MVTEVIMPKLGQTMEEGKIESWLKKEGDTVEKGDVLLEITTDKATLEVEAYGSGILRKIIVGDGETVPVTAVIGYIADEGEQLPEVPEKPKEAISVRTEERVRYEAVPREQLSAGKRVKASPLAKKIAIEKGIDIGKVKGTGPGGRITKEDVLAVASAGGGAAGLSPMRKAIAEQMSRSKREIPHYYLTAEIDMSEVSKERASLSLSFTPIIIKAVAQALSEFPQVNAHWQEGGIKTFPEANIGIAVALEEGLIVPVLRDAWKKTVQEISAEVEGLAVRAREKKLSVEEYAGATFTISNLGMFGIENFVPIINPPQVGILGIGAIEEKCAAVDGKVEIRPRMKLTLSVDHRAVDGVVAAQFLKRLRTILETANVV
jgi:pyruvate dehydrogenase E2 component (dihydrolipoamide acetyltransferase)